MPEATTKRSSRPFRILIWAVPLGAVLGLLVFFLRMWTWEPEDFTRELLLETGRTLGCTLQAGKTELRRFPLPAVVWHHTTLLWEKGSRATVETLEVGPDLLSITVGKLRISSLELVGLEVSDTSWMELLASLRESLPRSLKIPFFRFRLSSGRIKTRLATGEQVLLSNLGGGLDRKLSRAHLRLSFDVESSGRITLLRGVALELMAPADLSSALAGRISVQEPMLGFNGELRGLSAQGFDELVLASPSLDLASARTLLLRLRKASLAPPELPELLRAGKFLDLEVRLPGKGTGLSWERPGLEVRGRLQGGQLVLPDPWGVLKDLEARVRISGGTLELSSLRAKAGAGDITAGSLSLGVAIPEQFLSLGVWFDADIRQLHRIFEQWIREEPWKTQIRAFYRVGGKARGRLVLQGPMASPKAWLELQELALIARHKEFPYAIEIRDGSLLAWPEGLAFEGLKGTLGTSSFSGVSGSLDLSGEAWLDLRTGPCVVELEEIWALLKQRAASPGFLESLSSLEGRLSIREAEFNGPPWKPETWRGRGSAHLEGRMGTHFLNKWVELTDAVLEFTQEGVSLEKAKVAIGAEKLFLEGNLRYRPGEELEGEARISGGIGREIWGLVREFLAQATGVNWREPTGVELLNSRISWSQEQIACRAELVWEEKVHLWGEVLTSQGGFRIRELRLQGPETDAIFALEIAPGVWELAVEGHISGSTLDFFTEENPLSKGWVKGQTKLKRDPLHGFMLMGEITAGQIPLARLLGGGPWALVQGKLSGNDREIFLEIARLNRLDKEVLLRGEGSFWKGGLEARATLETMALGWEELAEITQELTSALGTSLVGTLGLRLGELKVGKASIRPFHADLELDPSGAALDLKYALLCGVNVSGKIQADKGLGWTLHPVARAFELEELLGCLGVSSLGLRGKADLDGEIWGQGFEVHSMESIAGSLEVLLHEGELQAHRMWPAVLETLKGFPELRDWPQKAGFGAIRWEKGRTNLGLNQGSLKIKELWLEGSLMEVLAQGVVDLFSGALQLEVLLEPKGIKAKGSKDKGAKPIVALALEGSLEQPRVYRLQTAKIPKEFLEKLTGPRANKTKAPSAQKAGRNKAK